MTTPEEEKQRAHLERTKKAVLGFLAELGGSGGIAEVHAFSETRWFVGHQRFSQMMEQCVADGLVAYDDGSGTFTLTDAGRAFAATES